MIGEHHRQLRESLRRWTEAEIEPYAASVDRDGRFPKEAWKSYVANGWVRMQYPEEYEGDGADAVSCALLIEEMARVCASSSLFGLVSKLGMLPVINWASPEMKRRYLPRVARGDDQASYCLSEADAGSDVGSMRARAVRDGEGYRLSGTKAWVTNAGISDLYTVFAKTDPDAGHRGISAFVVEGSRGIEILRLEDKLGVRGSPTGLISLDGIWVPRENLIGEEGQGFYIAMHTLDRSRPTIGAQAVGIAQGALDNAVEYVKSRRQFGKAVGAFQGIQFMLADMTMRIEAARGVVYRAFALTDQDPYGELTYVGAMAKCFASDVAMQVTLDAVQLLGGYGYTKDYPLERMLRDAKITQIYEGTNQIQRTVIARSLLG